MFKPRWQHFFTVAICAAMLAQVPAVADNIPGANRGHVGAINTGALGRMLVGNGANGFAEQNPPRGCPLSMTNADVLECAAEGAGELPADACGYLTSDGDTNLAWDLPLVTFEPPYQSGKPDAGEVVFFARVDRTVDFVANFGGGSYSFAAALDGATSDAVYTIARATSGAPSTFTDVGTITFAGGGNGAVQRTTSFDYTPDNDPFTWTSGYWVKITAPSSQDATLSGVTISIAGVVNICAGG